MIIKGGALGWLTAALVVWCLGAPAASAQPSPETLAGRRLEDALRVLQARGLRLVFSSELVTSDMRVRSEPRAKTAREQLAEILEAHGLAAESGPDGVIQVVRQKRPTGDRSRDSVAPTRPAPAEGDPIEERAPEPIHRERVTVTADLQGLAGVDVSPDHRLDANELGGLSSYVADDPLRTVQALPGVAGGDDFRSEYSVRGSPYRHAAMVVDGVVAPWLQHAAPGRGDTGTVTMLASDMVQEATLLVGAYPRRDGSQLGPQLNLTLREGSRAAPSVRFGVSLTSATLTAEGPLGARGSSARGSWLVGARSSHAEWPVGRSDHQSTVFAFSDVQAKLVHDVRPGQQISLTLVAGVSNVERENPDRYALADGVNRAAMVGVTWRSMIGSRMVVTQRLSSIAHEFQNRDQAARPSSRGTDDAAAYRVDVARTAFGGLVEAGGYVRRVRGSRHGPAWQESEATATIAPPTLDDIDASWWERSGYASLRRPVLPGVSVAAGVRLGGSTLVHQRSVDRWLRAEWSAGPQWLLHGSTGVVHQLPALEQIRGWAGAAPLRPERARFVDFGIGQRVSASVRWDATVFARRERDVWREPDVHARVIDGVLAGGEVTDRFENALSGSARGIEVTIERRDRSGFSGWVGYSYGVARYTDVIRRETFQADFDQRHTINLSGVVPLPWAARVGLTFRGGTNFPIPGHLVARNGQLFAGDERNRVRLPAYARLDLRAERTFHRRRGRLTLFAEAINVLNRVNVGLADGAITRETGEAVGFTERLFPRLVTAGVRVGF